MSSLKVVFLGSKSIGLQCFNTLIQCSSNLGYEIIAVLTNERGQEIRALGKSCSIPILKNLDEYLLLPEVDIAISVQYHQILKAQHIQKARIASFNLHMAPLPEYRGCNQFSFAILNGEHTFGTTLHLIDEGVDSGDIIFERRFAIPEEAWVNELLHMTEAHSHAMFVDVLPSLVSGDYTATPQNSLISIRGSKTYKRADINDIKEIDLTWPAKKIERHIRATSMPGFSGPYLTINGKQINLTVAQS